MKKVELLAPAGNFEALIGALNAGADAIYLGGNAFGARAYADNFSEEEIIKGIQLAHLLNKKIYLTVNTLVKEKEFKKLYDFLLPFYKNGLDGVIIQDLGVFQFIKNNFPELELHVSTQMTVTGTYGARMLKEAGAVRIVPARELSLQEIKEIKENVDIEIETFIHGAMCYCYSGQCLFSSILGGRSGNRGRCAQPCRLPYKSQSGSEEYPLSMKDMCTLSILPELIEAGIDSFKIEGRMKKPEYAAGVTALYRKYIDMYYSSPSAYTVDDKDLEYLRKLYIRSDIQEGYYHMHNGREMITLSSPAYEGSDDVLLSEIREKYLSLMPEVNVYAQAYLYKDNPARLELTCKGKHICKEGGFVQQAKNQPLSKEKICEQLSKSGNTSFHIHEVEIFGDNDIFMPIGELNQLRRDALCELENVLSFNREIDDNHLPRYNNKTYNVMSDTYHAYAIHVVAKTIEQITEAAKENVSRIYVNISNITTQELETLDYLQKKYNCRYYIVFPYIVRNKDIPCLDKIYKYLENDLFDGALVRNLETISYLLHHNISKPIVCDYNLYAFNKEASAFFGDFSDELYLPAELNSHEWMELLKNSIQPFSAMVYGRLPMMISANCIKKTSGKCDKKEGYTILKDRYGKVFPIYTDCTYCYNIIYNSVPLSLHKMWENPKILSNLYACRLDFTDENAQNTREIIKYFKGLYKGYHQPVYHEFTTGHYKRGVE